MLLSLEPNNPLDGPEPDQLIEAGVYERLEDGFAHGLVVLAAGEGYWLVPSERGHRLLVERQAADHLRRQLALYDRESVGWPPVPIQSLHPSKAELATPLVWAAAVLLAFWAQSLRPEAVQLGALDSQAFFDKHEWWRAFTALFLHANVAHLLSNVLSGIFAFAAVTSTLGRARGWLAVIVASILGNCAAVAVHVHGSYRSIGASTAVFAAVGLLTGHAVRRMVGMPPRHRWRAMFVPLAAGLTVVALYGAGGVNVDVVAHLTGFAAGVTVGLLLRVRKKGPPE